MKELVFFLEEASARAMLEGIIPRLLSEKVAVRYVVFEGKRDLEDHIIRRLRGYLVPDAMFVILRDQDSSDCHELKTSLVEKCRQAGKSDVLVRIACHELESWYLADLYAVEKGLRLTGITEMQNKKKFRTPDNLSNPYQELRSLTKNKYQKVGGSRAIGPHLDLSNQRSRSFSVFITGVKELI